MLQKFFKLLHDSHISSFNVKLMINAMN